MLAAIVLSCWGRRRRGREIATASEASTDSAEGTEVATKEIEFAVEPEIAVEFPASKAALEALAIEDVGRRWCCCREIGTSPMPLQLRAS